MLHHSHVSSQELRKEYCPPIDEGLFEALRLDFDNLTQDEEIRQLRQVLDHIKEDAVLEEATGFDPSGTSSLPPESNGQTPESSIKGTAISSDQDIESLTTGLSEWTWDDPQERGHSVWSSWDGLSLDEKVHKLASLMPQTNETTIRFTLRKHHAKFDETMDELLTLAFLDEDEKRTINDHRGLDEYALGTSAGNAYRKRNRKQRLRDSATSSASLSTESLPTKNVWTASKEDIEFVVSRTTLSAESVKSLYHAQGASLPATIAAIAMKHGPDPKDISSLDPNVQINAADLRLNYPNIPEQKIFGLLKVTRNIPSATEDLIKAMTTVDPSVTPIPKKILPKYTAPSIETEEWSTITRGSRTSPLMTTADPTTTQRLAAQNRATAQEAFTKASTAFRRGKSDKLMSGAAAYYSSLGREHMLAARTQLSASADAQAALQSGPEHIDLHGINVLDAVRIASDKTQQWWDNLGDSKFSSGGRTPAPYRIITGVGHHSKRGALRIGPAVTKRLLNEGWKVDIGYGQLLVLGKRAVR